MNASVNAIKETKKPAITVQSITRETQNPVSAIFQAYKIQHLKKKSFLSSYYKTTCNISASVIEAQIDRSTYYEWIVADKNFALAVEDIQKQLSDEIEQGLISEARAKNMTATIFFLKNKHPEYKEERQQVNVQVNNNMSEVAQAIKSIATGDI